MAIITQVQAPVQTVSAANPAVFTFVSNVTAGNIVVAQIGVQAGNPPTPTDSFGDSGGAATAWAAVSGLQNIAVGGTTYTMFWRVIGNTPSGKTISWVNGPGGTCEMDAGEYSSSDSGTWGVNGTPVTASGTSANPSGGNITTTANAFIYNRFVTTAGGNPTAGTGYTLNFTGSPGINRNAQEWGEFDSITNQPTAWVFAISDWRIMASAFAKTSSATRPVKMAGEWGGFAGSSGGFAG